MKLKKGNILKEFKSQKIYHNKNASEDLNYYNKGKNMKNVFVSKFLNQSQNSKIKTEIINDNLPCLTKNIQNIFSNEDQKEKAIQYLIKIRKDKYISPPNNSRRRNYTSEDNKIDIAKERCIKPYNLKNNINSHGIINTIITSYNLTDRSSDRRSPANKEQKIDNYYICKDSNRATIDCVNKKNLLYDIYNDNIININNNNKKKSVLSLIYNNTNNNKVHKNKNKNTMNQYNNNNLFNNSNSSNNTLKRYYENKIPNNIPQMNNYAYTNYIKNMQNISTSKIRQKLLYSQNKEINNYSHRITSPNINNHININKPNNNSFYIPKKHVYIKTTSNENLINDYSSNNIHNSNLMTNRININENNKNYITTQKDEMKNIRVNRLIKQKNKNNANKIKKIFNNNNLYKRNTINISIINNTNKNNLKFKNDEEIIEFIKNKYKHKINKIFFDENKNNHSVSKEDEEENEIKQKNEELLNDIKKLKKENKQYKKELIDIKNQYNDLNKELALVKKENEKLKNNIIKKLINDNDDMMFNDYE